MFKIASPALFSISKSDVINFGGGELARDSGVEGIGVGSKKVKNLLKDKNTRE